MFVHWMKKLTLVQSLQIEHKSATTYDPQSAGTPRRLILIKPLVHTDQKGNNGFPKVDDQVAYKSDQRKTEHPEKKLMTARTTTQRSWMKNKVSWKELSKDYDKESDKK